MSEAVPTNILRLLYTKAKREVEEADKDAIVAAVNSYLEGGGAYSNKSDIQTFYGRVNKGNL